MLIVKLEGTSNFKLQLWYVLESVQLFFAVVSSIDNLHPYMYTTYMIGENEMVAETQSEMAVYVVIFL